MLVWCGKEYSQQMAIGLRYIHEDWKKLHEKIRDNMEKYVVEEIRKFSRISCFCPQLPFPRDSETRNNVKGNGS